MIYRYHQESGDYYLWAPAFWFWIRIEGSFENYLRELTAAWGGEDWVDTLAEYLRDGAEDDGVPFDGDVFQPPKVSR